MEKQPKKPQLNFSPFLPNAGQMRVLLAAMGKERASDYFAKIMDETLARYHFDKLMSPAQRLYEVMKRQGMTQGRLRKLTGISTTSLSKYWSSDTIPKRRLQECIAAALGVTPNEIWGSGAPEEEKGE